MIALTAKEAVGDRSVEDFVKWVENFAANNNQSGHFHDTIIIRDFGRLLKQKIKEMGEYVDKDNVSILTRYILTEAESIDDWFVSKDAALDFSQQVVDYVENDEFIGVKPSVQAQPTGGDNRERKSRSGANRRRRKTS